MYKYGEITGKGYITMWGAEDVLYFYGTILGAAVTIIALVITINHNQKLIQRNMKEQRIRVKFQNEKEIADNIVDIILLKKYGNGMFYGNGMVNDHRSLIMLTQDLNSVVFEALARIPTDSNHTSSKIGQFYSIILSTHKFYKSEIDKLTNLVSQKSEPQTREEAEIMEKQLSEGMKNIAEEKNKIQDKLWFAIKGLYFQLNEEMNSQIDELYGIRKEQTK